MQQGARYICAEGHIGRDNCSAKLQSGLLPALQFIACVVRSASQDTDFGQLLRSIHSMRIASIALLTRK